MKKRVTSLLLAVVVLLFALITVGCDSEKSKYTAHSLELFDTATTITGYERTKEEFDKVSSSALAMLEEYHKLFTIYNKYDGMENICTVNELVGGVHREVTVDARVIDMLVYAKELYHKTNGNMNVAMGSVLSIWHQYRTVGRNEPWLAELPPMAALSEAAKHTNIDDVIIDTERNTVFLADPQMSLDVGAIAKGYAVEMVARALEAEGISGYVLNVGGNVRTIGAKPDGERWIAGIENPDDSAEMPYIAYLELAGESVVTSGSYQRFYTVGDKNYHHIIDPKTLMPAEGYLSVSVVCRDSGLGDALSTALFCMSLEDGIALVEATESVEAMWVLADGTQKTSRGFDSFVSG